MLHPTHSVFCFGKVSFNQENNGCFSHIVPNNFIHTLPFKKGVIVVGEHALWGWQELWSIDPVPVFHPLVYFQVRVHLRPTRPLPHQTAPIDLWFAYLRRSCCQSCSWTRCLDPGSLSVLSRLPFQQEVLNWRLLVSSASQLQSH